MAEFKVGDVVRVKGQLSPLMTVAGHDAGDFVTCIWFDQQDRLQDVNLQPRLLEHFKKGDADG